MSASFDKHTIPIVSACMKRGGTPAFAMNQISVTHDEAENGIHYYLAEANLLEAGFEEPFVHFPEEESPAFLHPAVRAYLASPEINQAEPILTENVPCPA